MRFSGGGGVGPSTGEGTGTIGGAIGGMGYGGGWDSDSEEEEEDNPLEEEDLTSPAPTEARFETLQDGSTALIMPAGQRFHLKIAT